MIWENGNNSLREIGEFFGELDYAGVAQRIRRVLFSHDANAARKLMTQIAESLDVTPSLRTKFLRVGFCSRIRVDALPSFPGNLPLWRQK